MTIPVPTILIVADDAQEREAIASLIEEAGVTAVIATGDSVALLREGGVAGAVVALADGAARRFLRRAAVEAPRAKLLLVSDIHSMGGDDDRVPVVQRPLEGRELIGGVLDMILREEAHEAAPQHGVAAELSITAAKLACLCMRETSAAACGAGRMIRDLSAQIADFRAGLAAPMMAGGDD